MGGLLGWWRKHNKSDCKHLRRLGIHGDEVTFATPRYNRLFCVDCYRYLNGPVSDATVDFVDGELKWLD